jgi:very-short-patch-repair endonuclease
MAPKRVQASGWELAARQHGVVTRRQLLEIGLSTDAIRHRLATGRLHRVRPGAYAVGRPRLTLHGQWMAAVLSCGDKAALSHQTAAALWEIGPAEGCGLHVSVPAATRPRQRGVTVHRRTAMDVVRRHGIPVTSPPITLIDSAAMRTREVVEAAINAADRLDLVDPEELRAALGALPRRPGIGALRRALDRHTFTLTDSQLERRFLPIARRAGLPAPATQCVVNGYRVDFYWPALGLVVETDGLRYHRTPAQQANDRRRDQAHTAAGLTTLRFTHAQVRYEPQHVRATLAAVLRRSP